MSTSAVVSAHTPTVCTPQTPCGENRLCKKRNNDHGAMDLPELSNQVPSKWVRMAHIVSLRVSGWPGFTYSGIRCLSWYPLTYLHADFKN